MINFSFNPFERALDPSYRLPRTASYFERLSHLAKMTLDVLVGEVPFHVTSSFYWATGAAKDPHLGLLDFLFPIPSLMKFFSKFLFEKNSVPDFHFFFHWLLGLFISGVLALLWLVTQLIQTLIGMILTGLVILFGAVPLACLKPDSPETPHPAHDSSQEKQERRGSGSDNMLPNNGNRDFSRAFLDDEQPQLILRTRRQPVAQQRQQLEEEERARRRGQLEPNLQRVEARVEELLRQPANPRNPETRLFPVINTPSSPGEQLFQRILLQEQALHDEEERTIRGYYTSFNKALQDYLDTLAKSSTLKEKIDALHLETAEEKALFEKFVDPVSFDYMILPVSLHENYFDLIGLLRCFCSNQQNPLTRTSFQLLEIASARHLFSEQFDQASRALKELREGTHSASNQSASSSSPAARPA